MSGRALKTSTSRLRMLTEDRLIRILQAGGMCLQSGGRWQVYRKRDKRSGAMGLALQTLVERLEAEGRIGVAKHRPQRRIWTGEASGAPQLRALPMPEILRPAKDRRGAASALDAALKYETDDAARIRLIASIRRYVADLEQAATPDRMTMQWGQSRVDSGRNLAHYDGPNGKARSADGRLCAVEAAIGADHKRALDGMVLRETSIAAFERFMAVPKGDGGKAGYAALTALAEAYDLRVKAA